MSKQLIIAEKPSVANDIARALGGSERHGDYFENKNFVLSSAVGHLLELRAPEEHDPRSGRWTFKHLPVIPPHFDLVPIAEAARLNRYSAHHRKDVSDSSTPAMRSRRRIDLPLHRPHRESEKADPAPMAAVDDAGATGTGSAGLRPDRNCCHSPTRRSPARKRIAVGIMHASDDRFHNKVSGPVSTRRPWVACRRRRLRSSSNARAYPGLQATRLLGSDAKFGAKAGEYPGRWFDPQFKRDDDGERKAERLWEAAVAEAVVSACQGKQGIVSEETKPSTQLSPLLFDLTSLQREANGRFGFSARGTLSLAQALYERHKVLTYPRTDARALPEDYIPTVKKTLELLSGTGAYAQLAKNVLKNNWVKPNKRIFDNSKISDHFAIIPTLQAPRHLNEGEQKSTIGCAPFPGRVLPARRVLADDTHHEGRGAALQDRGQDSAAARLACGLRPDHPGGKRESAAGRGQ